MPAFLDPAELEALQRKVHGTTPERMLREFAEVLEALTAERPVLLVLEDLHWSDAATVDLVAWLARRRQPARLLLIGTYRPVEVIMHGHPLREVKQELELHRLCTDLPLEWLNEAEVEQYLTARFGGHELLTALAPTLYRQTGGNPLFMVTVVDSLLPLGTPLDTLTAMEIAIRQVPESLRGMIEMQLGQRRPEERQSLEIASVRQQAAAVAHMTREVPVAATHLEDVLALTTEHAFPFWQGLGQIMMAWTHAMQGHESSALTQLRQGLEVVQATGMQVVRSWCLGLLAEVAGHVRQLEVGLAALHDALAFVERTDERFYEAELYRLQGELLLQSGPDHAMVTAEGCFQQALAVARRQQARSWELRAAMSLSRLWWQQNKCGAAYQLLSGVYNWFGEGFDTADLQDARALLDDLAS